MFFSHHDPPHQNDATASDGAHTPFSSLDTLVTPPVFLIVISLLECYIKTVISLLDSVRRTSFCIFCI